MANRILAALRHGVWIGLLLALLAPSHAASSQGDAPSQPGVTPQPPGDLVPVVRPSLRNDVSPALREIPPRPARVEKAREIPLFPLPRPDRPGGDDLDQAGFDPVLQDGAGSAQMPAAAFNFEGIDNRNGVYPPDTNGDVGPNHYMQWVNLSLAVWQLNRSTRTATLVYGPVDGNTLWTGFGGVCENSNDGDPIVLYDHLADRWMAGQFALPNFPDGPFYQCMAVSQTGDPTGAWHRYEFLISNNKMNDYPHLGVWPDGYYMSINQFWAGSLSWAGGGAVVFERSQMLLGQPTRMVYFDLGNVNLSYGGQLPADLDGPAPPAGTPNYFAQVDDIASGSSPDQLSIWEFHVDWDTPANSTFGLSGDPNVTLATAPFDSSLCFGSRNCIPQPGGTALDAISDRLMHRLQYRNYGGHQALATNHTVDVDGADHAGVRWYELRRVGGAWSIYQQGTYAPDADHRWMGSAALDANGNLAVGYSVSSATVYPSIRYAGRLAGDPLGTLPQGEGTLINGAGYQTGSAGRWGDYSMLGVDPTDGCTFWFTSEYYAVIGAVSWQTRVGSFRFPSCSLGPQGTLKGVVSNAANAAPLVGAVVQAASSPTQTTATQSAATGAYTMTLPVGIYTVTTSLYGYLPSTISGVSVMSGTTTTQNIQLTAAPGYVVSGTIRDATTGWPLYASLMIGGYPGGTIWNNPVTGFYSVTLAGGGSYTFNASAWAPGYLSRSQMINPLSSNRTLNFGLSADVNACAAPGYKYAGNGLFERFETQALPSGWSNIDNLNNGQVWLFNDPKGRGNLTGGSGGFAILDSDYYGAGSSQDAELRTPVLNFSTAVTVPLEFDTDFNAYDGGLIEVASVDVSNTGGASWTTVYSRTQNTGDFREHVALNITALAAGQPDVVVRFHYYNASYEWWWEVDNVKAGVVNCGPQAGGLVVGNTDDANTGAALPGANVVNDSGASATSLTTADPAVLDSFYTLFSPAGSHVFTATKSGGYGNEVITVAVVQSNTVRQDFNLPAGYLAYLPPGLQATLDMGLSATVPFTLANSGGLAAAFELLEIDKGVSILGPFEKPEFVVRSFRQNAPTAKGLGLPTAPTAPPYAAGDVIRSWPTGLSRAWGIAYDDGNDAVWVSSPSPGWGGDNTIYEYTPLGQLTGRSHTYTWDPFYGPADAAYNWSTGMLWLMDVSTGESNCLYEIDPASGYTGNTICPGGPAGFEVSQRGLAYDPTTDTWYGGGWNDSMIYHFDSSGAMLDEVYVGLAIAGLAYNPDTQHLFVMVNADPNPVYVLDAANQYALLGQFAVSAGFGSYAGAGLELDCDGNLWAVDQNTATVYQFESGETTSACGRDVTWLMETPVTGTVAALTGQPVAITFDANAPEVTQPGQYYAQLKITEDTPYDAAKVPVTLTVNPPANWGKLTGAITGLGYCDAAPGAPLEKAAVYIQGGMGFTRTLETDVGGVYHFWLDQAKSPLTVTIGYAEYMTRTLAGVSVSAGLTTTQDAALRRMTPCASNSPATLSAMVVAGRTSSRTLVLNNAGAGALTYETRESLFDLPPAGPETAAAAGSQSFSPPAPVGPTSVRSTKSLTGASAPIPNTPAWFNGAPIPGGLVRYAHAQCPDEPDSFYVFGGVDGSYYLTTNAWRYDVATNAWNSLAPLPVGGEGPAAACYSNKIYVMGGSGANQFFIYDIAKGTWSTGPALPRNVWGAAAGAWNGRVYLIGGDDDFFSDNTSNRVDIYDIAANAWLTTPPAAGAMPTAAVAAGFVQAGPNLYVVGGWGDASPTENVTATQRYNMQTNTWSLGPALTSGRADFALAMTDQALYAIGGDADRGTFLDATDAVQRLSLAAWPAGAWTVVGDSIPASYLSNSAGFCTSGITASEVWSVGGLDGDFFSIVGTSLFRPSSTENCYSIYSDVPWLSEAPASGGVSADGALSMTINFNAANLSVGVYRATLTLVTNDSVKALVRVPVTLTVNAFSGGLNLTPAAAARTGQPGATVTYTLLVTNTGNALDTFSVTVGGNQWATTAPATVGPVASGASASLPVMVTIPANQVIGTSDVVTVTVTSQSDNAKSARAVLTTTSGLLHGVVVAPPTIARSGNPGAIVTYTLTVVNTGNALDQYDVSVSSAAWTTTAPTTIGPLAGGASASVTVAVTIPGEAEEGQTETAALTVTSRSDPTKSASSTLTTTATAMPFRMFLPVVRR